MAQKGGEAADEGLRLDLDMYLWQEHGTFRWLIEGMLKRAGFKIVEADYFAPDILCMSARRFDWSRDDTNQANSDESLCRFEKADNFADVVEELTVCG